MTISQRENRFPILKHHFTCPHCGERICMLLDMSADSQRYVEDCEVCCNPIEISYGTENGKLVRFEAGIT